MFSPAHYSTAQQVHFSIDASTFLRDRSRSSSTIPINLKYGLASTQATSRSTRTTAKVDLVASKASNLVGIVFAEQHF